MLTPIAKMPMAAPYVCTESAPAMKTDGDNPSFSSSADLPVEGDTRIKGPSPSSNPTPGKVGA